MTAPVLAAAEGAVAELALVLLLGLAGFSRSGGGRVGRHGCRPTSNVQSTAGSGLCGGSVSMAGRAWALKRDGGRYGEAAVLLFHSAKRAHEQQCSTGRAGGRWM